MAEETKTNDTQGAEKNLEAQKNQQKQEVDEKIVLTKEELDKKLQAEADKRVTSALKTAQAKWEEDYEIRLQKEKAEAEKLAKLSDEEKRKVLDEKRERELAEREKSIYKKELEIAAIKILDGKKLPVKFAHLLLGDNADETHANIETFEKEYHEAIERQVNERMKGFTPKSSTPQTKTITMNDIIRGASRK
jgi:serine phosphatase RsbU (regulator of sigma subunit)